MPFCRFFHKRPISFRTLSMAVALLFLTGCALPWSAHVPGGKGTAVSPEPAVITGIWVDAGTQGVSVWISGSRDLDFSAVRRPDPPSVSLYFPQTVLHVPEPEPVSVPPDSPVLRIEATSSRSREKTAVVQIDLSAASDAEIRRHPGALQLLFQKKEALPAKAAAPEDAGSASIGRNRFSAASGTRVLGADVRIFDDHARIRVLSDGPIQDFNAFAVRAPARIVFDLFYVNIGADAQPFEPDNTRWFRRIEWEHFPDRVRMLIETEPEWLDLYQAQPVDAGLLVRIGKGVPLAGGPSAGVGEMETAGANAEPPSEPAQPSMEGGLSRISRIDISSQSGGKVSLTLHTTRPASFRIGNRADVRLLMELSGVVLPERFRNLFFDNGALQIAPLLDRKNASFSIVLNRPVPYYVEQDNERVSVHFRVPPAEPPGAVQGTSLTGEAAESEPVRQFLTGWVRAWEQTAGNGGQMDPYMAHYSDRFRYGAMDKEGWRRDKEQKNSERQWISGQWRDLRVWDPASDGSVRVRFLLDYRASNYSEVLEKEMLLVRESGGWRILSEETRLHSKR